MPQSVTPCLMFTGRAEEAIDLYVGLFDGTVDSLTRYGPQGPGAEGSVLVVRENPQETDALERVLAESDIQAYAISAGQFPNTLAELNAYEAVILANEPAFNFTEALLKIGQLAFTTDERCEPAKAGRGWPS